jgi:hypothetical protein
MKLISTSSHALLAVACLALTSVSVSADDKKKLYEWQQQQQEMQQQWKQQEILRQQQLLRQQQVPNRNRSVVIPASPWGVNQKGRGVMSYGQGAPDRLNFVVVTLNNFYGARGTVNNSGLVDVTFYGSYSYPFHGTWTVRENLTVSLNLVPAANTIRGDRATGNLWMTPPNGARLARIDLKGVMSGIPFAANFAAQ